MPLRWPIVHIMSMKIPDYQTLMRPVLQYADQGEVAMKDAVRDLAKQFDLSKKDLEVLLPSKRAPMFYNRVAWAKTYLQQAGLVESTRRGFFVITESGKEALNTKEKIDNAYLANFKSFKSFKKRSKDDSKPKQVLEDISESTPDEVLQSAHKSINNALSLELISTIRNCSPMFFEQLIVDLLLAMGYGGTSEDAGRALGQTGDNGVDGVIDQDPLGVDQIYIQAKRYKEGNTVGSSDIRDFFGSLSLKKATKGIFVTTSAFTSSARETAKGLSHRIVLIDGEELARLLIRYNVGCRDEKVLHIKKIDDDYFDSDLV